MSEHPKSYSDCVDSGDWICESEETHDVIYNQDATVDKLSEQCTRANNGWQQALLRLRAVETENKQLRECLTECQRFCKEVDTPESASLYNWIDALKP